MIARYWMKSPTKQVLTTSLIEDITISRAFSELRPLVLILLLEQSQTYSSKPNAGNVVYRKVFYPMLYWDKEQKRQFIFLTNAMELSPLQVAELYKNRWQVELFFKWFKQHLKIKKFWGNTENTVRIQIYSAIITYCLVATIQHDLRLERSTYEVLQILSISLTDKTLLSDLFNKANFKNDKERSGSSEPNLFNF